MATAQNLIESALRLIDQLHPGYSASSTDLDASLEALNRMLDEWAAGGAMVYQLSKDVLVSSGLVSYVWGSGGAITSARPVRLKPIGNALNNAGTIQRGFRIVQEEEWASSVRDVAASGFPEIAFYDYSQPSGALYFHPFPPSSYTITLWSFKTVSALALNTTLAFPPGYEAALRYNLAVILAPEFRRQVPDSIASLAAQTKSQLATLAAQVLGPMIDMPAPGGNQ